MKRAALLLTLISLLLAVSSMTTMAQVIIVPPTSTPTTPPRDSDGDGLPDTIDQCPLESGPTATFGCPERTPEPPPSGDPNQPPSGDPNQPPVGVTPSAPPRFVPPMLPDGCFITPSQENRVNVRRAPSMDSEIIGSLLPGVVYPALGYVVNGADVWMQVLEYVGGDGATFGYSAQSVLMTSLFCPEIPGVNDSTADDFASNPLDQPTLCFMSVGYDANYWGSGFDPALSDESTVYAAFYFAANPGDPILEGTPVWGVISIDGYNELPPESPYFFQNPDNAFAVASDQALIDAAISGGVSAASPLAFPNPNGGVMAVNGTIFYRLSDPDHVGTCGPIVAIDDLVIAGDAPEPQAIQCFTRPGTTIVESCWCESGDSDCVDFLVSICYGGGAYVDAGPDMTACWFDPASSAANFDDLVSVPDDGIEELECATRPGTTIVEACWCPTSDGACVEVLTSICYGAGAYIESGPDTTACWYEPMASPNAEFERCIVSTLDHAVTVLAWARVDGVSPFDGRFLVARDLTTDNCAPNTLRSVRHLIDFCQDEFGLWWVDVTNPSDPFDVHGLDGGTCGNSFDEIPATSRPVGAVRLVSRLPQPGIDDLAPNMDALDCDANGVIDTFQTPMPECAVARNADKETAAWWRQVLDLTCPGGWIMATEIDEDGKEIVTDALCDD